ncbi:Pnap_2097 family protein [Bradyrhizobium liaoningense]
MLKEILRDEFPKLSDHATPLSELDIDSFGLVALRARIEQALGRTISDASWCEVVCPNDILRLVAPAPVQAIGSTTASNPCAEVRSFSINMPQMAIGGLSESWLFKELGDLHWNMITSGLEASSSTICDGSGDRLYATFTRISLSMRDPLRTIGENSRLTMSGAMTRTGAGIFTSQVGLNDLTGPIGNAVLMSSFSKREGRANTSLLKGQPTIPTECPIPEVEPTTFAKEYRVRRSSPVPAPIFECEYQLIPFYDINGVGLLYFAAYPIINDICATRYREDIAAGYSTTERDIYYFNNANPDETILFRIHAWDVSRNKIVMQTSLSRQSDGAMMAYIHTSKANV